MEQDEKPSVADAERQTRTIGTLTRTVDKIKEFEADDDARRGRAGANPSGSTGDDAERLRRELAQRIQKLKQRSQP